MGDKNILKSEKVYCTILNKEIDWSYCLELCNIGTDDVLLEGDDVPNWDEVLRICKECGIYYDGTE